MNTSRTRAESPQAAESTRRAESTRSPRGGRGVRRRLASLLLVVGVVTAQPALAERIVSVGGTVTEIVYALGAGDALVGVDTSSVYPPEAGKLPQVGYQRTLSAEGVLSLSPTLVLVTPESGPPAAIEHLRAAGLRVVQIPTGTDVEAARAAIRAVAATLDRQPRGEELVVALDADLEQARAVAAASTSRPRVLFVYARGAGTAMVSGKGTAADEMIRLAGAVNAVSDYDGFRPLTAEGVVAAAPEVVLVPARGLDSLGGKAGLLAQPGLSLTPAARGERVVAMDDLYLLGFGPRTGRALADLARALHGDAVSRARDPIGQGIGAATVRACRDTSRRSGRAVGRGFHPPPTDPQDRYSRRSRECGVRRRKAPIHEHRRDQRRRAAQRDFSRLRREHGSFGPVGGGWNPRPTACAEAFAGVAVRGEDAR